jgi:hypothetical protein
VTIEEMVERIGVYQDRQRTPPCSPLIESAQLATIMALIRHELDPSLWEKLLCAFGGTARLGPVLVRLETKIDRRRPRKKRHSRPSVAPPPDAA